MRCRQSGETYALAFRPRNRGTCALSPLLPVCVTGSNGSAMPDADAAGDKHNAFPQTRWSMVVAAREDSAAALEHLCRVYWPAIYAFSRRSGDAEEDARDLTQGFFAALLEKQMLGNVSREKGQFRSWLLAAFTNFSRSEWRAANRLKRGGGLTAFSLDAPGQSDGVFDLPDSSAAPDQAFERKWVESLLRSVLARLRREFAEAGKEELFDALKIFLTSPRGEVSYADAASATGLSEGAVKSAVHRMRQRYGALLRDEVAQTVERPEEVEDEIRWLMSVLAR